MIRVQNLDHDLEIEPEEKRRESSGEAEKTRAGIDKFTPKAVLTLVGSWLAHTVVGSQYAWGNMSPYIVSYFRNQGKEATASQFYAILPLIVVVSTFIFPFGMKLSSKIGSRRVVLVGAILLCVSTYVVSVFLYPLTFFFVWAVGFGIAKGFLYPAPLRASWSHLPGRKGFVSGAIVSGLGFGAFIYGIVVNRLVNPDNLQPVQQETPDGHFETVFPPEVSERVPKMLLTLGICWAT